MRPHLHASSLCVLAALASAQEEATPSPFAHHRALARELAEWSSPAGSSSTAGSAAARILQQGKDYSPRSLFSEYHGQYLQRSRRYEPAIRASYQALYDAEVKNEPGSFDLDNYRIDATVPFVVDPDNQIRVGARYGARHYKFSDTVTGAEDDTYHEAGVTLGFGSFFSDSLYFEGKFTPGLYSDLDNTPHTEDYKWYGNALLVGRANEDVFWKLGVGYDGRFEDLPVYPRLGLTWVMSPNFRFDLLAPEYVEFSWLPSPSVIATLGGEVVGNEYRTYSSVATGKIARDQEVQEINGYLGLTIRLNDNFGVFGKAGLTLGGDYEIRDAAGQNYKGSLETNFYFEFGFGIDF